MAERITSDLTIVGAGVSGICAAIAAARHGLKVALINDRPVPGGNSSSEIGVSINGAAHLGSSPSVYSREGGIVEEIKLTTARYDQGSLKRQAMWDAAFFDLIYREKNISLYLNTVIHDVEIDNSKVQGIYGLQLGSEKKFYFASPLVIDSSGDGVVGQKAGALYLWGREARGQFNESLAPVEADHDTMGSTLVWHSKNMGRKVTFKRPEFAYDITKMEFFKNIREDLARGIYRDADGGFIGLWWVELGAPLHTITDNEDITLELRKLVYGFWDYIKNSGKFKDVDHLALDYISPVVGKRESRRFIGEYILTQNDIMNKTHFEDAVAIGGWPMDVHAAKGIYDEGPATHWYFVPGVYHIPFRCLYSANISNLMFAGRDISATQIAFGSTRVAATGGCMGQAVGTAAAVCRKYNILPGQIREKYMYELVDTLQEDDQTILGFPEKQSDELTADLTISASSTKSFSNETSNDMLPLDEDFCLALPVATKQLESLEIGVKNHSHELINLEFEIWGGEYMENYMPAHKVRSFSISIEPCHDGWVEVPVACEKSKDSKVFVVIKKNKDLALYSTSEKLTGAVSFIFRMGQPAASDPRIARMHRLRDKNICFKNVKPYQNLYDAGNLVNGYSRPYGLPNLWISEEKQEDQNKPEYICFKYSKPKDVREIHLIFNSMLEEDNIRKDIPVLIKDYTLEFYSSDGQQKRIKVTDNYLRLNKHKIEMKNVIEFKIYLKANYGSKYYELYSVKLF